MRYHPLILNETEPWSGMSTWLKSECSKGIEAACIDRVVGITTGLLRFDKDPAFPTSGRFVKSVRLADINSRMKDGFGFWDGVWRGVWSLGADNQVNRKRPLVERPTL